MLPPKSDPEVAKKVIVVKYNGTTTTGACLMHEVKHYKKLIAATKKVIASIEKELNEIKESERKRKRNEKDRERRRLLKENNPKLYEEKKRIRNEKARTSDKMSKFGSKRKYHTSSNFFSSSAIHRLLILDDSLNEGIYTAATRGTPLPLVEVVQQDRETIIEKYKALIPFKRSYENILSPIYLTQSLLYSLDRAEKCLSKLPLDSLVKRFILNKLEDKFKITAKLDTDWNNILNTVRFKDPYLKKKIIESVPNLDDKFEVYHTEVSYSPINFTSYSSSIFRLEKIYGSLHTNFNNDNFIISEHNNLGKKGVEDSLFDDSLCGCYIIYSKNSLYYYIGHSNDIRGRLKTHYKNFKSLLQRYSLLSNQQLTTKEGIDFGFIDNASYIESTLGGIGKRDLFKFYINSCYENKVDFDIEMGPICLYQSYFQGFLQKYPDYKLSVGEYLILTFYSDLIGKILEQSLIYYYNPL